MRIYKYVVPLPDEYGTALVNMHRDAEVLSVGMQNNQIVVWAKVNGPKKQTEDIALTVVNTGTDFPLHDRKIFRHCDIG